MPRFSSFTDPAESGRLVPRAAPRLEETASQVELGADRAARCSEAKPSHRLTRVGCCASAHDLANAALRLRMTRIGGEAKPLGRRGEVLQVAVAHTGFVLGSDIARRSLLDGAAQAESRRCLAHFAMGLPAALLTLSVAVADPLAAAADEGQREGCTASVA